MAAPMSKAMRGRFTDVQRLLSQIMILYDRNIYRHCRSSTIYLTTCHWKHDYAISKGGVKAQIGTSGKENPDFFGILEHEEHVHDDQSVPLKESSKFDYLVEKRKKKDRNVLGTEFGHVRYDKKIPDGKKSIGSKISSISMNDVSIMEREKAANAKQNSQRSKKNRKAKDSSADQYKEKNSAGEPDGDLKLPHMEESVLPVNLVPVILQKKLKTQSEDIQAASEVINSQCTTQPNGNNDGTQTHPFKKVPKVDNHVRKSKFVKDKTVQPYSEEFSSETDRVSYFDEQYFQYDGLDSKKPQENQKEKALGESALHSSSKQVSLDKDNHKLNYFDEQYFNYEGQYSNLLKLEDSQHSVTTKSQPLSESSFQSFTDDFQISSRGTMKTESECFSSKGQEDSIIDVQYFQGQSPHPLVDQRYDQVIFDGKNETMAEKHSKNSSVKSDFDNTMIRDVEENPFEELYFAKQSKPRTDEKRSDDRHETLYIHTGDNSEVNKSLENNTAKNPSPRLEKKKKLQLKTGKEVEIMEKDKKTGKEVKMMEEDKKIADSDENTSKKERKIKKEHNELKSLKEDKKLTSYDAKKERKVKEQGRETKSYDVDKIEPQVFEKEKIGKSQKKENKDSKSTENDTISAHDVAMEIRNKMQKNTQLNPSAKNMYTLDSKGFRILKGQVRDLNNMPNSEVLELLYRSIIYNENDIVAINKPYGLPSHGGPGVEISVGQFLPSLAEKLDRKLETLHLIHRLDKEATGVMLLARTPEMAWRMNGAFRHREVIKKYWAITKNVPKPTEGIINIPMAEGTVQGKTRMVLRPDYGEQRELLKLKKNYQPKYEAVTRYRVRDSHGSAALVECMPETGIKHQIRVHLAFGLNTPILGDHKYSHFDKLAPQRLPPDILHRLKVQQSKVRYVPMHLHAVSVMIPEFLDGKNFYVSATLPMHFVRNLSSLKLKINP
ncbi:hypothetical protein CHS0354_014959 [Potamilus streckersoni]|uniref:Pseudouridylate synthase RPUSD4, mitochondrial n=1 Tax=Potamilus streckersoni TaxID=2493646 RepID=A0AAE0VR27_9BIVA|nr:hypothetical protein CHS0354_014959 [Potamilus streckersoni]